MGINAGILTFGSMCNRILFFCSESCSSYLSPPVKNFPCILQCCTAIHFISANSLDYVNVLKVDIREFMIHDALWRSEASAIKGMPSTHWRVSRLNRAVK